MSTDYPMYKRAPAWHGLFASGRIDLSENDSRTKHPRHFGNPSVKAGAERRNRLRSTAAPVLALSGSAKNNLRFTLSGGEKRRLTIAAFRW